MDTKADRPRWRFTASHRITPRLQVGIEANPGASEIGPIGNWVALTETAKQPMVSFGTSSDRIFSPEGNQSYYMTVAKSIPGSSVAPYVSLYYSEWEDRFIFPFGANIALSEEWDFLPMHDGRNTHLLLTYKLPGANVTVMLVKMQRFGVSVGWGF